MSLKVANSFHWPLVLTEEDHFTRCDSFLGSHFTMFMNENNICNEITGPFVCQVAFKISIT